MILVLIAMVTFALPVAVIGYIHYETKQIEATLEFFDNQLEDGK